MDESAVKPSGDNVTGNELATTSGSNAATPQDKKRLNWEAYTRQSTVLTLQDLVDLSRQVIPEPTYRHLRNAGIEAWLAVTTLADSLNDAFSDMLENGLGGGREGDAGNNKARRHINVE